MAGFTGLEKVQTLSLCIGFFEPARRRGVGAVEGLLQGFEALLELVIAIPPIQRGLDGC